MTNSKLDLISIGEVMAEIRSEHSSTRKDKFAVGFAGDTFNTTVYCKRLLGDRFNVGYHTHLGQDPLSKELEEYCKEEELKTRSISTSDTKNIGIYSVSTDEYGERSFCYWRENSAARQMFTEKAECNALPKAKIIYLSGISIAILSPNARSNLIEYLSEQKQNPNTHIAFDSNYRPKLWEDKNIAQNITTTMWDVADIALPSIDDEMDLFEEDANAVIARFSNKQWHACAIKRSVDGPISPIQQTTDKVKFDREENPIDTTAAGDSFNGGYLAGLLQGKSELDCLQQGHNMAMQVVTVKGAIIPRA